MNFFLLERLITRVTQVVRRSVRRSVRRFLTFLPNPFLFLSARLNPKVCWVANIFVRFFRLHRLQFPHRLQPPLPAVCIYLRNHVGSAMSAEPTVFHYHPLGGTQPLPHLTSPRMDRCATSAPCLIECDDHSVSLTD